MKGLRRKVFGNRERRRQRQRQTVANFWMIQGGTFANLLTLSWVWDEDQNLHVWLYCVFFCTLIFFTLNSKSVRLRAICMNTSCILSLLWTVYSTYILVHTSIFIHTNRVKKDKEMRTKFPFSKPFLFFRKKCTEISEKIHSHEISRENKPPFDYKPHFAKFVVNFHQPSESFLEPKRFASFLMTPLSSNSATVISKMCRSILIFLIQYSNFDSFIFI